MSDSGDLRPGSRLFKATLPAGDHPEMFTVPVVEPLQCSNAVVVAVIATSNIMPRPAAAPACGNPRAGSLTPAERHGIRTSLRSPAIRFSSWLSSDSLTGPTIDQCSPTGHH
jgi:hypothetical protein